MEIDIIRKRFNFFKGGYEVFIENVLSYTAIREFFSLPPKIQFFSLNNTEVGYVKRQTILDYNLPKYDLFFNGNSLVRLSFVSFTHYRIYISKGVVDVYEQQGLKLGIFINNIQVGVIEKSRVVSFGGRKYHIIIDSNEIDKELVIAFMLAYAQNENKDGNAMISIDLGNFILTKEKEIDPNWRPKN
jgi:hypothetical protein